MIRLIVGYALISVAVLIGTTILLYAAYGFGLGKNGEVIQNGLVFASSRPSSARIFLNDKLYKSNTNARMQLEAGQYNMKLQREGYRPWQRTVTVDGGSVQHFNYPLLIPSKLTTTNLKSYPALPGLATQSPDRRWLVVQPDASPLTFDLFDTANPDTIATEVTALTLPETVLTTPRAGQHSWKLVEWSTDNRHILMQHTHDAGTEYVLIDREEPELSLNLTRLLALDATKELSLRDKKFDRYYVYDTALRTLGTHAVSDGVAGGLVPLLEQVIEFKQYGSDKVLYVTNKDAPAGKVHTLLREGDQTYKIRELSETGPYLMDMAEYSNDWYVAVGATPESKIYVYKNPQRVRKASRTAALVPVQILKAITPNTLAFSSNAQFVMAENGTNFSDYDAETDKGYSFVAQQPLDAPATGAFWMDGHRLAYVSGSKLVIRDYDNNNAQTLMPASPNYKPFFDRDYDYVYTLAPTAGPAGTTGMTLTSTTLLTPNDL